MRVTIVSGFFNPLHGGHLDMIEAAALLGDKLIVIVNNDNQQILKKGKVILNEQNRERLVGALRVVDEVVLAVDEDLTVVRTLAMIANQNEGNTLVFANGGDRASVKEVPETQVCRDYTIKMAFGVGGNNKTDSSTRINQALGYTK